MQNLAQIGTFNPRVFLPDLSNLSNQQNIFDQLNHFKNAGLQLQQLSQQPLIVLDEKFLQNYRSALNVQELDVEDSDSLKSDQVEQVESLEDEKLGSVAVIKDCAYATSTAAYSFAAILTGSTIPGIKDVDNQKTASVKLDGGMTANFNFCEARIADLPDEKCKGSDTEGALAYIYDGEKCISLQTDLVGIDEDIMVDAKGEEVSKSNGLKIIMSGPSDTCKAQVPSKDLTLTVNVTCDPDEASLTTFVGQKTTDDPCEIELNYTSHSGCYVFNYGIFETLLFKYKDFWGAAFILFGIFLAFFGNGLLSVLFLVITAFATWAGSAWLVFFILTRMSVVPSEIVGWVILGLCAVLGGIVGFCFYKHRPLGLGLLAACGGVALGFLLNVTFFIEDTLYFYLIIVGCAIVLGVVTYFLQETVVIMITSFLGSYAIVRGASLYAGGFPSELDLHDEIKNRTIDWESFPKIFYAYLGGIALLTIASAFYQFRLAKKKEIERSWKQAKH